MASFGTCSVMMAHTLVKVGMDKRLEGGDCVNLWVAHERLGGTCTRKDVQDAGRQMGLRGAPAHIGRAARRTRYSRVKRQIESMQQVVSHPLKDASEMVDFALGLMQKLGS